MIEPTPLQIKAFRMAMKADKKEAYARRMIGDAGAKMCKARHIMKKARRKTKGIRRTERKKATMMINSALRARSKAPLILKKASNMWNKSLLVSDDSCRERIMARNYGISCERCGVFHMMLVKTPGGNVCPTCIEAVKKCPDLESIWMH